MKRADIGRDLLTILYLLTLFMIISFYFGSGNLADFVGKLYALYPPEEIFMKMQDLILLAASEGSLGITRNGEPFEAVVGTYVYKSIPIIITAFALAIPLGIAKGIFDYRKKNTVTGIGQGLTSFITSLPDFFLILSLQWITLFLFRFIDWSGTITTPYPVFEDEEGVKLVCQNSIDKCIKPVKTPAEAEQILLGHMRLQKMSLK